MQPDIAQLAALVADNARSKMLMALMGGRALTATELAISADVMPQTASGHLAKLLSAELLVVRKQGRHKYFQLRDDEVAGMLEGLLNMAAVSGTGIATGPDDTGLRQSRICYDHLAGEYGVAVYDALVSRGLLLDQGDKTELTIEGRDWFARAGVDFSQFKSRRPLCKSCLDWSERRNHLAGSLGQWLLDDLLNKGWASRVAGCRTICFTAKGLAAFRQQYGIMATDDV